MTIFDKFELRGKAFAEAAVLAGKTLAGCAGRLGSSMKRYSSIGGAPALGKIQPVPPSELDLPAALILPGTGAYRRRALGRQRRRLKTPGIDCDQSMEVLIKKYRPGNGTDGEIFISQFCERCQKDDIAKGCNIQLRTMAFGVDETEYPVEWQYDADGNPTCTAFL
jgi:hypothetical protein